MAPPPVMCSDFALAVLHSVNATTVMLNGHYGTLFRAVHGALVAAPAAKLMGSVCVVWRDDGTVWLKRLAEGDDFRQAAPVTEIRPQKI